MAKYTSQQLADLRAAIALGALKVDYSDGRSVTYRSQAEMLQLEAAMAADLAGTTVNASRTSYGSFAKD